MNAAGALTLLAVGLFGGTAHAGVVINELLPDPDGADGGKEWVELYNDSDTAVSLDGWRLESGTSSYGLRFTFDGSHAVPAFGYLVIGGADVPSADVIASGLTLGNVTSSSDAVRLVRADLSIADTVVYGEPNDVGWLDDTGVVATSFAPAPPSDASLARRVDGLDTDRSGDDFHVAPHITPGEPNPEPLPCEVGYLVINEFLPDPPGADEGQEWIELYNPGSQAVNLAGWTIDASTSSFGGGNPLPDVDVPAGGYLVLGHLGLELADVEVDFSLGNATSNADGVQLRDCEGAVVDTVIYGEPNTDGWLDDTGEEATSLAPKPGSEQTLARLSDGYDTDLSGDDFIVEPEPTPGAANREVEPVVCVPASGPTVVLNELMVNPDGSDDGLEWIEIYNPLDTPVSIDGWGISWATNAGNISEIDVVLPGGLVVPPGGFFVIGDELVEASDLVATLRLPNGTNGDGVMLFDCEGTRVDTVIYGPNNDDMIDDDRGDVVPPYITSVSSGGSLARVEDGVDTDEASDWFGTQPTPGASNAVPGGGGDGGRRGCSCRRSSVESMSVLGLLGLLGLARRRRR